MSNIILFFNHPFFIVVGGLTTLALIWAALYSAYLIIKGVLPVWVKLGIGLSQRKIAIFADQQFSELKMMLEHSEIFEPSNIQQFKKGSVKSAAGISILLVHWASSAEFIDDILQIKKASDALIVYAPRHEKELTSSEVEKITNQPNSILVNFRGRLLNDILISMITTSYKK